jgi:hypothetical protein
MILDAGASKNRLFGSKPRGGEAMAIAITKFSHAPRVPDKVYAQPEY